MTVREFSELLSVLRCSEHHRQTLSWLQLYSWCVLCCTQSCLTLRPRDCSLPGSSAHRDSQARILEWVAMPSPGDLPNPGIKPRSHALSEDSLPSKPPGKPWILEWVAYPNSRGSSWTRNQTRVSFIADRFFTRYEGLACPIYVYKSPKIEEVLADREFRMSHRWGR